MNLRGMDRPKGANDFGTFGDEVAKVPHDYRNIFVIRNLKVWDTRWPFHAGASGVMVDGFDVFRSTYGVWRSVMDRHGYRHLTMTDVPCVLQSRERSYSPMIFTRTRLRRCPSNSP